MNDEFPLVGCDNIVRRKEEMGYMKQVGHAVTSVTPIGCNRGHHEKLRLSNYNG